MDVDIDNDLDGKLLQQFSSMGTQDRDVLISEFQKLLNNDLNPSCCSFFLDMNNWYVHARRMKYTDTGVFVDTFDVASLYYCL